MLRHKTFIVTLLTLFFLIVLYNLYWAAERLRLDYKLSNLSADQRAEWLKNPDNYKYYRRAVENSFTLGLDLQGGMYVTLEIGVEDILRGLSEVPQDSLFEAALAQAVQRYRRGEGDLVSLFSQVIQEKAPQVRLAQFFAGPKLGLSYNASDQEVLRKLRQEVEDAVDRTYRILRTRIDQFGVVSPNIQRQPGTGRILLELPGVKDSERVRRLLRTTAKLEFWPTYTIKEVFPLIARANEKLRAAAKGDTVATDTLKAPDSLSVPTSTEELLTGRKADTTKADTALSEEEKKEKFFRENPLFSVLVPPQNPPENSPVVGYARVVDTAKVNAYLSLPEIRLLFPENLAFAWTAKGEGENADVLTLIALKVTPGGEAPLTGEVIEDARQDFNPDNGRPMVSMRMNPEGARIWKRLTTDYVGKSIAVTLDGLVYTYPTVENVIANGHSQITGNFTVEEAKDLANVLKAGRLPATIRIEAEEIIGPSLGETTIRQGLFALATAFLAILLVMWLFYSTAGLIADLALLLLLLFIGGVMAAMQVVLTLPGIAGIVLTLGMAVDANVLIYERILEELRQGRSLKGAIEGGIGNALSAIVDSNLTTLLTGIILYIFGIGPIRGFAVTLIIGIIGTLLTGVLITRLLVDAVYNSPRLVRFLRFRTSWMSPILDRGWQIRFDRHWRYARYGVLALVIASLGVVLGFGLKPGLEFTGGYQFQIALKQAVDIDVVQRDLSAAMGGASVVVKTVGAKNDLLISTSYLYDQPDKQEVVQKAVLAGLSAHYAEAQPQIIRSALIGPSIAEDIQASAYKSVLFGILGIALYILLRFRSLAYSVGSAVSLGATVVVALGLYALFSHLELFRFPMEANQDTIAALLTIIGFVINDAVIFFDRVREERRRVGGDSLAIEALHARSINLVLTRTILTTFTAVLVLVVLLLLGGENTKGFALLMAIGFIVGIFGTIYVAADVASLLWKALQGRAQRKAVSTR